MFQSPSAPAAEQLYVVAGDVGEQLDMRGLRDRIRAGLLAPDEQVALAGTDGWRPAAEYPSLARYFALAQQKVAAATPSAAVHVSESVASRILPGLVYPFTHVMTALFLVVAFVTALVPLISALVSILGTVYSLAIIRASSAGEKRPPELTAVGGFADWVLDALRIIAVMLISGWPVLAFVILISMRLLPVIVAPVAFVLVLVYYPACLVAIAKWKSLNMTLSVSRMFSMMGTLGSDYAVAVIMGVMLFVLVWLSSVGARFVIGPRWSTGFHAVATVWTTFYASHLLGWAVGRHADEL